jgi:predicted RNase H-like HicB family nuclease
MARHRHRPFGGGVAPDVVTGAAADALTAVGDEMSLEIAERAVTGEVSRVVLYYSLGMELHVAFEPDEGGWVRATIEELPGVITCAPTREEARELIHDALDEWLAALTSAERATVGSQATRETLTLSVA